MVNFIPPANQWAHVIIRFEALIFPKKPLLAHKRSGNFGLLLHCRPVNVLRSRAAVGMIYSSNTRSRYGHGNAPGFLIPRLPLDCAGMNSVGGGAH